MIKAQIIKIKKKLKIVYMNKVIHKELMQKKCHFKNQKNKFPFQRSKIIKKIYNLKISPLDYIQGPIHMKNLNSYKK